MKLKPLSPESIEARKPPPPDALMTHYKTLSTRRLGGLGQHEQQKRKGE